MRQILNDVHLRRAIQLGVFLVVGCCIISQVMMQLGGGERDERVDLTDQLPKELADEASVSYKHLTLPTICSV